MSAVARVARVEWHSVGGICKRVYDEVEAQRGVARFDGLRRIGIDETSYKRGHRYLTVVVDHDRGCLVWAHEGYGRDVLSLFLDELTREQRRSIEVVTADGARWIKALVRRRCPNARWVMDPFHVVQWMNDALDEVRREEWQAAKAEARAVVPRTGRRGRPRRNEVAPEVAEELRARAASIKGSRYAVFSQASVSGMCTHFFRVRARNFCGFAHGPADPDSNLLERDLAAAEVRRRRGLGRSQVLRVRDALRRRGAPAPSRRGPRWGTRYGAPRSFPSCHSPPFPSISEFSSLWLGPPNSTSLPWCTTLSTMAAASLSSANTVPHLENSTLVVNTTLRRS